jgi:HlyD family secretion protein
LPTVKLKRWLPRIIVFALAAGAVAFLVVKKPWAKGDDPITFPHAEVTKGNIAAQVTANGTLSAVTTVQVGAQVSGRVVELHADFNDKVTKGEVIAKLDDVVLKSQVDQAAANLALAAANVNKAQVALVDGDRQLKRQKSLQDQNLVAGVTVEEAQVTADTARAALVAAKAAQQQAEANLAQAKLSLAYATIYSPVDGVVLSRAVDVGQTVAASLQAPVLFTIAVDLARMQIDTSVAEGDVGRLTEGMKATFTVDAFPGRQFNGVVRQVRNAPTTTQGVVTYDAVIDVDNGDHALRPGMTANVTFVLAQVADAIKIPNAALRFKPTREQLMAVFAQFGGRGGRGSGGFGSGGPGGPGRRGSGDGAGGPGAAGAAGRGMMDGMTGSGGPMGQRDLGDKKRVFKLVDGRPHMVLIKPGLTDGSSTEMLEGDLKPGDELVTDILGVPTGPTRKLGAF